ncbi:MAG: chemotaxis response regulator protein-glutamate methylesterase [Pseudomonadota bacterium]|nr:chemotaxis response regulator protein-glutamate methylesterase [Pseudomonadota bacterium]
MPHRINVLIIDDSVSARRVLVDTLRPHPDIAIFGEAGDAFEAARMMRDRLPDVILLDLELPKMDGLTLLSKIMAQHPIPVIICSSHSEAGSRIAMRALEAGAVDVIAKSSLGRGAAHEAQVLLGDKVVAAALSRQKRTPRGLPMRKVPAPMTPGPKHTADVILPPPRPGGVVPHTMQPLIAIGASTGGTEALRDLLPQLGRGMPPVVVTQHMPENFTAAFAARLNTLCEAEVREATNGDRPQRGQIFVAPGNRHMILRRQGSGYRIEIVDGPQVSRHRPSVDVLFRSVAIAAGPAAIGVLLTGMGDDGARSMLELKAAGAETIAQDEPTSVVWGMPGEAVRLGAARRVVPLNQIAPELARALHMRDVARS